MILVIFSPKVACIYGNHFKSGFGYHAVYRAEELAFFCCSESIQTQNRVVNRGTKLT